MFLEEYQMLLESKVEDRSMRDFHGEEVSQSSMNAQFQRVPKVMLRKFSGVNTTTGSRPDSVGQYEYFELVPRPEPELHNSTMNSGIKSHNLQKLQERGVAATRTPQQQPNPQPRSRSPTQEKIAALRTRIKESLVNICRELC